MIAKNLGGVERGLRLALGMLLALWAVSRPELAAVEWLAAVAALFLVLNAIYGRCYLWHLLDISSCGCNSVPAERFCSREVA